MNELSALLVNCSEVLGGRSSEGASPILDYVRLLHALVERALEFSRAPSFVWRSGTLGGPQAGSLLRGLPAISSDFARSASEVLDRGAHRALRTNNIQGDKHLSAALSKGACALLASMMRHKLRTETLCRLKPSKSNHLFSHTQIMRSALAEAREAAASRKDQVRYAFELAFQKKRTKHGRIPSLILVHDIDCDLCPLELAYPHYPNAKFLDLATEAHDTHRLAPWEARFAAASVIAGLVPRGVEARSSLLRLVGRFIGQHAYPDALAIFQLRSTIYPQARIESHFCTANNPIVAAQLAVDLGASQARIWAVDEWMSDGWDKPAALTEIVMAHPDALVVCSDDSDPSLFTALAKSEDTALAVHHCAPQPSDLAFFSARSRSDGQALPLLEALTNQRIPSFESRDNQFAGASRRGYQGLEEAVQLYLSLVREESAR